MPVRCARCGVAAAVRIAADGQPADFDPAFTATRLLGWLGAARVAMATGMPGVALGACAACGSPLAVSSREPVALPCPHCGDALQGTAAERVVDQWPEPWARVEGGGLQLEYRLALVEDKTGLSAGCAVCGRATPAGDPASQCPQCGSVAWVQRDGGRIQFGVRVDGIRDNRPFKMLLPIVQGEAMLRADAMKGTSGRSGSSLLGATGIGCAAALGVLVLLVLGVWITAHFAHC
jgi:predicted RNA-binding Zn-ribbon protein involved in translation (DUF1610 family)